MNLHLLSIFYFFCCSFTLIAEESISLKENNLRPFIKKYCTSCHGAEKQKAKVRLDNLDLNIKSSLTAQHWQDVLDTLNAGDMPPEKKKQPSSEELSLVIRDLTEGLVKSRKALSDNGRKGTIRRLNRREYTNTIEDLFGLKINPEELPEDDVSASYDTIGSLQFYSANHFDQYFQLAKRIVKQALKTKLPLTHKVIQPEITANEFAFSTLDKRKKKWQKLLNLWSSGKTWKEHDFKDGQELYFFARIHGEESEGLSHYLYGQEFSDKAAYLSHVHHQLAAVKIKYGSDFDPRGEYKLKITAGIHRFPPESRKFLDILSSNTLKHSLKISGTYDSPSVIQLHHKPTIGQPMDFLFREKRNQSIQHKHYKYLMDRYGDTSSIYLDKIEIEGPFYEKPSLFEKIINSEYSNKVVAITDEKSKSIIKSFTYEVGRRQNIDESFIEKLIHIYKSNRAHGLPPREALIDPLATVLSSPVFLYLSEGSKKDKSLEKINGREFVVRLANFLWSSMPDEQLYALAENGKIFEPKKLQQQIDRMLEDSRSKAFISGFMSQWFKLKRLDDIAVNPKLFPEYDHCLRISARSEPLEFFATLIKENLSILNFINSDFLVVDQVLANHYQLPKISGNGFRKIQLPNNSKRGGLLTSAAFLIMTSTGDRTSPIIRGSLIMEQFLNDKAPPPPPNVPELNDSSRKPMSVRKMIEEHQKKPQCSSCHKKIDPIGYGLENFDAIGRWRMKEKVGKHEEDILALGKLPSGERFTGINELKSKLFQHKDQLTENIVKGLFEYGLGRQVSFSDQEEIQNIVEVSKKHDYQARSIIYALVNSYSFLHK